MVDQICGTILVLSLAALLLGGALTDNRSDGWLILWAAGFFGAFFDVIAWIIIKIWS
jgi:hypothetical protein